MLKLENLKFAWEQTVFDFSVEIPTGSFSVITGPSGAGKSTLLDLIAGFAEPTSGTITFDGTVFNGLSPAQRPVSMVFQDNNLFAHLDVFTNVALGVSPRLKLTQSDRQTISDSLDRVELSGLEKRLPGELSGGQRQRVAIARAIVRNKPLLLLDEPFAALGPALRKQMLELVLDLHNEKNLTTLLVSHQPSDAKTVASHTAFIKDGKIAIYKPTDEFFAMTDNKDWTDYHGNS